MTISHNDYIIGQELSDDILQQMISEAPGPVNFTMFLTLFGEKLTGRLYLCAAYGYIIMFLYIL
jgi:hypothetical protein